MFESLLYITPTAEHYCCIVNGLGRQGKVSEAYALYKALPGYYPIIGMSILGACRLHVKCLLFPHVFYTNIYILQKNIQIAEQVAEELIQKEPTNSSIYVVLGNTYAAAGMRIFYKYMYKVGLTILKIKRQRKLEIL
jgi:pentatricopeptide repeat protein